MLKAEPKRRAATAATPAETNDGKIAPDPEVGLGAGDSTDWADAMVTATTENITAMRGTKEALEIAIFTGFQIIQIAMKTEKYRGDYRNEEKNIKWRRVFI